MRRFANLYDALDGTTSTLAKVKAMVAYFGEAPARDAAWALYFLIGRRLKRLVPPSLLVQWTYRQNDLPEWLVEDCYATVGDLAETTALLLDSGRSGEERLELSLADWIEQRLLPLKGLDAEVQRERITTWWSEIPRREIFLLNKLLTGELRVGVSDTLVLRALGQHAGLPPATLAHRVMGQWEPSAELFRTLIHPDDASADLSRPYPFCLAYPLEVEPVTLGPVTDWLAEWKWDGIRSQLIRRAGQSYLWSRGEELITDRFPEVTEAASALPDGTVLDGEVLAFDEASGRPNPFALLQKRIGRQKLTPLILRDAPVVFMAYDLLEHDGVDLRERALSERRVLLCSVLTGSPPVFRRSEAVGAVDWAGLASERERARELAVEGLMLKRLDSPYRAGRKKGDWWKWKIDPYSVDAVMIYAHPGSGRRANLFTDYTFGVWKEGELVPIAKAYSGLTDSEVELLDAWVRGHTRERFGPVRVVEPSQVFELHFEGIALSSRHKSGVAVRFPRIARWRQDKPAKEADTIETLQALLSVPRGVKEKRHESGARGTPDKAPGSAKES